MMNASPTIIHQPNDAIELYTDFEFITSSKGKPMICCKEFIYVINKVIEDTSYYKCKRHGCKARAKLYGSSFLLTKGHTHPPDLASHICLLFRTHLKKALVKAPTKSPTSDIYEQALKDLGGRMSLELAVGKIPPYPQLKPIIRKWRNDAVPRKKRQ